MRDEGVGTSAVVVVVLVWLAAAVALGAAGVFEPLRPPAPQILIGGLTALTLLATAAIRPLRHWAATVDVRVMVALHLTRLVAGACFLALYQMGGLPYAFAVPGGIGDILVGLLALGLLVAVTPAARLAYGVWNVLGLVDILFVVATATRIALRDPGALAPLLHLPLSVLPTWLVPLVIASHAVLALRLARRA